MSKLHRVQSPLEAFRFAKRIALTGGNIQYQDVIFTHSFGPIPKNSKFKTITIDVLRDVLVASNEDSNFNVNIRFDNINGNMVERECRKHKK